MIRLGKDVSLAGYKIIERVGRGGMGDVYKANQESLNRTVALKVLPPELSRNHEFTERFNNEAKAISLLEHQNIISIYDFGIHEGLLFFAMQYIEGESLDQRIEREKQLKLEDSIEISRQILRALKYAHEHKVIHRDIKPHNVLINASGKVFVTDFGIAKIFANTRITTTGMAVGTPEYMSPEQSEGLVLDAQTDIYSVGILMYEMMTGVPPFSAESPLAVAYKQVNEQPRSPYELNNEIPKRVGLIVLKALKKDKKQRYQNTAEMLDDLDSVVEEKEKKTRTIPVFTYSRKPMEVPDKRITDRRMGDRRRVERRNFKKNDYIKMLSVLMALVVVSIGFLFYYLFFSPQEENIIKGFKATSTSAAQSSEAQKWYLRSLIDGDTRTAWAEGASGAGINEYVLFSFRRAMVLTRINIWNGLQDGEGAADLWPRYNRLKKVELRFSNEEKVELELSDRKGCQTFIMSMPKTTYVRMAILDVYPGSVNKDLTCISEVELFGMRAR